MKITLFFLTLSSLTISCASNSGNSSETENKTEVIEEVEEVLVETDANLQSYIDATIKGGKMTDSHSLDFVKPVLNKQFIYSFDAVEELNYGEVILLTERFAIISFEYDGDNGYHMLDGDFLVVYDRQSGIDISNHLIESGSDFERHSTAGYNEQIDMTHEIKEVEDGENLLQVILSTKTHRYNFNPKITKFKNEATQDIFMLSEFYVRQNGSITADVVLSKQEQ